MTADYSKKRKMEVAGKVAAAAEMARKSIDDFTAFSP